MSAVLDPTLGPEQRQSALDAMDGGTFDIVIVGAGVTGVGCALDAASRGLSVALLEQRDLASGTSSRSSKLIHGGLRYLEQLNFALVFEALRERGLLTDVLAPHLVHQVRFLYPLKHRFWERLYVGAGVLLYDIFAFFGRRPLQRHRHLTRKGAVREVPSLDKESLAGAIQYSDAQVDDARHTLAVARTAARYGAKIASSCRVTGLLREGDRVVGVEAEDLESGRKMKIKARQVINATGVWTDSVQGMAGRGRIRVTASKGIHVVVPRDRIASNTGMIIRTEKSVLFLVPWGRHWIIGTTDTKWTLDLAHPAASKADIDYVLEHINSVLVNPLTHQDIEGVYAGLRPLLTGESDATSRLSREHAVSVSVPGLITVAGGKYTTYRVMAKDAVDVAATNLPGKVPESCTDRIPLVGADGYHALWNARHRLAEEHGLHVARIEHLLNRYGSETVELLETIAKRPELGEPLEHADDYLAVEIHRAVTSEAALHLDDVLTRRTRISIETFDRGVATAPKVAEIMAEVLGWDEATIERELAHYEARVAAERESQTMPDDHTADAARLGAPDVRTRSLDPG